MVTSANTNQSENLPWELLEKIPELLPILDVLGLKQVRNDISIRFVHDIESLEDKLRFP